MPTVLDEPSEHFNDDVNQILGQTNSNIGRPRSLVMSQVSTSGIEGTDIIGDSYPHLPPLGEIWPIIEDYFTHINSLIPLFSRATFTRMLHDYYNSACQNPRKTWAAINVVLALGTCLSTEPSDNLDLGFEDDRVAKYIDNAQSVVPQVVSGDMDFLSLQILLGLVIIFSSRKDSSPAVMLIGMAVRLAHRLRLHSRHLHHQLSSDEALQRNRVFWIAYLFDRDICLRHHTPSVQDDADIDLDLPVERPPDGAGNVYTKDGKFLINFFRLRLRLAYIQGRVYTMLFSSRASKITPHERQARVALLHNQLEHWRLTVPSELHADVITEHASRPAFLWLCMMHFSYLGCLVMIHGMWSHDAEWRKRLIATPPGREVVGAVDRSRQPPPLPRAGGTASR